MASFFSKERTIAPSNYNRWLIPPAALAVHLCIGMAYGFSVFWKPLGNALVGADGQPQIQLQTYVAMMDFGCDIQQALEAPRWLSGPPAARPCPGQSLWKPQ